MPDYISVGKSALVQFIGSWKHFLKEKWRETVQVSSFDWNQQQQQQQQSRGIYSTMQQSTIRLTLTELLSSLLNIKSEINLR